MFSIVVVSWNNLPYLKLLVASILEHSSCPNHEIIVHVQEYCAQTIKWLETQGISYTGSRKNIGLAAAANMASENATREFICLIDDDMYVLDRWYLVTEGDNIVDGKKSIAFNVTLEPKDKTLNEKDIEQISKKIVSTVQETTGATLRS